MRSYYPIFPSCFCMLPWTILPCIHVTTQKRQGSYPLYPTHFILTPYEIILPHISIIFLHDTMYHITMYPCYHSKKTGDIFFIQNLFDTNSFKIILPHISIMFLHVTMDHVTIYPCFHSKKTGGIFLIPNLLHTNYL